MNKTTVSAIEFPVCSVALESTGRDRINLKAYQRNETKKESHSERLGFEGGRSCGAQQRRKNKSTKRKQRHRSATDSTDGCGPGT